jgi:cytochrome c oxidase subunit 3
VTSVAARMSDHRVRVAVWLVIASEALLFAGLFGLYTAYRSEYPNAFDVGVQHNIAWMGGTNTIALLASSFAVAWAIHMIRHDRARAAAGWLYVVIALGCVFLVLKGAEWTQHVAEGIVPGPGYHGPPGGRGIILFFVLYYLMTGLHAAHVVAGLVLITWALVLVRRQRVTQHRPRVLELVGLYWHFVDVVWVFLWPMFYLMRR